MELPIEVEDMILRLAVQDYKQQVHQELLKQKRCRSRSLFEGYASDMQDVGAGLAIDGYQEYTAYHKLLYFNPVDKNFCLAKNCFYSTFPLHPHIPLIEQGRVGVRDIFYASL